MYVFDEPGEEKPRPAQQRQHTAKAVASEDERARLSRDAEKEKIKRQLYNLIDRIEKL